MNEEEFLKQLDKRLQNVATKDDLKSVKLDFESVKSTMATKDDLKEIKDDFSLVKVDIETMKEDWGGKINRIDNRVNDVYNLADKIAKGIEKREQEFYARESQIDRKIRTIAEKVGIDFKDN